MKAVVFAGGKGTRLVPDNPIIPKPMTHMGNNAIPEIILYQSHKAGTNKIILTVNHLADLMCANFQDGSQMGVSMCYRNEGQPLGKAGPLGIIDGLEETYLGCSADVFTTHNIQELIKFHKLYQGAATIASQVRAIHTDLGVIENNSGQMVLEDPVIRTVGSHVCNNWVDN
jgi:NDP-sugar pyrophosphorylase family protein